LWWGRITSQGTRMPSPAMQSPNCDRKAYLQHRPGWVKALRWVRFFYGEMMTDLAEANIAQVQTGELALEKSKNDQVKTFAQQMVDDHTAALEDFQTVAQSKASSCRKARTCSTRCRATCRRRSRRPDPHAPPAVRQAVKACVASPQNWGGRG
jgi:Domain of unknown function (DUF4142)